MPEAEAGPLAFLPTIFRAWGPRKFGFMPVNGEGIHPSYSSKSGSFALSKNSTVAKTSGVSPMFSRS